MNSTRISLIVIRSSDMEAALAFYRALGLSFVQEQHGAGPQHYACDLDGLIFEIYPARAGETGDSTMIGFAVESLDKTLAGLRALGPLRQRQRWRWADGSVDRGVKNPRTCCITLESQTR